MMFAGTLLSPVKHWELAVLRCVLLLLTAALFFTGCARHPLDQLLPRVSNMEMARHYFGEPTSHRDMGNGTLEHEWILDRMMSIPGQYVTRQIRLGSDSDGYPRFIERTYWAPTHQEHQVCRLRILASDTGQILRSDWEGNRCEELLRVPIVSE